MCNCKCQPAGNQYLIYNTSTQEYIRQRSIPVIKECNGFTVRNNGTTIVILNGEPIMPGDFKAVGGNAGEIYGGRIDIYFTVPTPAPVTITRSAWVTQKFYIRNDVFDKI